MKNTFAKNHIELMCKMRGFTGRAGFVYLLHSNGLYKIGRSVNVKKRIEQIKIASPYPIELIASKKVEDCHSYESILHSMFAHNRVKGEWFLLDKADLELALTQY